MIFAGGGGGSFLILAGVGGAVMILAGEGGVVSRDIGRWWAVHS